MIGTLHRGSCLHIGLISPTLESATEEHGQGRSDCDPAFRRLILDAEVGGRPRMHCYKICTGRRAHLDENRAGILSGKAAEHWSNLLARAAPFAEEIDEHLRGRHTSAERALGQDASHSGEHTQQAAAVSELGP